MKGLTVRQELAIENMVILRETIRLCGELNTTAMFSDYGIATFDQAHLIHLISRHLTRTKEIIKEESE